jgi:hypothetical protein
MASIFDSLCGESGIVNQISDTQDQIREAITTGKNAINSVKTFAEEVETLADAIQNQPGVVTRRLQEDIFNLLSQEALADPSGTLAQLLEIRAAYQSAGPAVDRIIENVEQFIKDPLNTPLNLCKDIPNIVKFGDEVRELAQPGVIPDKPPELPSVEDLTKTVGESIETIPRFPTRSISEALEAAGRYADELGPGAAQEAALAE